MTKSNGEEYLTIFIEAPNKVDKFHYGIFLRKYFFEPFLEIVPY